MPKTTTMSIRSDIFNATVTRSTPYPNAQIALMLIRSAAFTLPLVIFFVTWCGLHASPRKPYVPVAVEEVLGGPAPPTVSLRIKLISSKLVDGKKSDVWLVTYGEGTQKEQFGLEIAKGEMEKPPTPDHNPNVPKLEYGNGAFIHVPGSHCPYLTRALAKVMEARSVPNRVQSSKWLDFTYVVLGENQTRKPDGSFVGNPRGTWRAMKFFIGDDGEFFFNMSPKTRQAEFAQKDPAYGDYNVKLLASVL